VPTFVLDSITARNPTTRILNESRTSFANGLHDALFRGQRVVNESGRSVW